MADEDFTSNKATKKARKVTPTPKARTRHKSRINPKVVANIVHLSYERRKQAAREKWHLALKVYLSSLDKHEFDIAENVVTFITQRPFLVDKSYSCEVIPFQAIKK